jgi:hypothetical protein
MSDNDMAIDDGMDFLASIKQTGCSKAGIL